MDKVVTKERKGRLKQALMTYREDLVAKKTLGNKEKINAHGRVKKAQFSLEEVYFPLDYPFTHPSVTPHPHF